MNEQKRWMIVGLGNPGRGYAKNRHNIGYRCVERLARRHDLCFDKRQGNARLALGWIRGQAVVLAKPQTFMNDSGRAVGAVSRFYKVPMGRLLVIYDELDIPLGTVRLRASGGSGGHGGMRSLIQHLGGQGFPRVRVGIGRPPGRMDPADFVLQDLSAKELEVMEEVCAWVVEAAECWLTDGIEIAMTRYNGEVVGGPSSAKGNGQAAANNSPRVDSG
jgi:PTH1 family peptidyl-tRNA hydrolase